MQINMIKYNFNLSEESDSVENLVLLYWSRRKVSAADKILWRVHIQTSGYRKGGKLCKDLQENHMQDDPR